MKSIIYSVLLLLFVVGAGCGSSKKVADQASTAASPYFGTWALDGSPNSTIQFLASGDVVISQGDLMTNLNRFQNTSRTRYMTRLKNEGSFTIAGDQLTLHVMADWTGRGTGATRAADKSVESTIVFAIKDVSPGGFTLEKVSMSQPDGGNMNADEALSLKLVKKM
ncbi:MAG: hypothetical protein R2834_03010 [Rhodothermales bacterium]